jgi:gliding motility-associated lipoprotein GldD
MFNATDNMKNLLKNKIIATKKLLFGIATLLLLLAFFAALWTARTSGYVPKPYGHPYIPLPTHSYTTLAEQYPYYFEVSTHAIVQPDSSPLAEPYWINIHYPIFQADIQITYKPVKNDKKLLQTYLEDSYKLSMKHHIRAHAIDNEIIRTPHGIKATIVTLAGPVPTPFQFYTTDSSRHFLRGALYFSTSLENDYLAPIIDFIKIDMMHMLHTLQWKPNSNTQRKK